MKAFTSSVIAILLFSTSVLFVQCSGKKALEKGNYAEAVLKSVQKLRKSPTNKKAASTLRQAYPLAVSYYKEQIELSLKSNDQFKWGYTVQYMETVNNLANEISRCPAAKKIVPSPFRYESELNTAKKNAAEECYVAGKREFDKKTRESAREAYYLFVKAGNYVAGYKDIETLIPQAKELATLKVVLEQIPVGAGRLQISAEFFQNNIEAYINDMFKSRQFLELYLPRQAEKLKLVPDHVIRIQFDDFIVGNSKLTQKTITVTSKDSVKVGEYTKPDGTKVPVKNRVTAEYTSFRKEVISKGLVDVRVIEFATKKILMQDKMPGEFIWISEWASFNGDDRALTQQQLNMTKQREVQPPAPQDLFVEFTKPIYDQVTSRLSSFYSRY
ncbi:MAG TPA: hypothetical protein PK199_01970 [Bacteroidales bacterium]|nr:hypothetical protein [Bacteroidales bacterium]